MRTMPTAIITQIASSYWPSNALTALLPISKSMSGFSYTCLANLRRRGSEGGSTNSLGPYLASKDDRDELDKPSDGCASNADSVS